MNLDTFHNLVDDTFNGWSLGEISPPGAPVETPDLGDDLGSPVSFGFWMLEAEDSERFTVGTSMHEGAVLVVFLTQNGDTGSTQNAAYADLSSRFRAASAGDVTFDPVDFSDEIDLEQFNGWEQREFRVPYRRQEHY